MNKITILKYVNQLTERYEGSLITVACRADGVHVAAVDDHLVPGEYTMVVSARAAAQRHINKHLVRPAA